MLIPLWKEGLKRAVKYSPEIPVTSSHTSLPAVYNSTLVACGWSHDL